MPSFETSRRVHHTAAQMFALVADIEAYPQFLPLCKALKVTRRSAEGETETLVADMEVGYKAIRETFTSKVVCERPLLKILVNYIDGPFKHLENTWRFRDVEGQGSQVEFHITYEFKSRMLSLLVGGMFDAAFRKFAEAFERRADQVYGRS
ncbi:type II toxin-antitoxin system RatA family toxin [Beijerinckia sp. L45]|uniref:type II toxin-antitoxin system RatA family toxin n=1 Tax=Beijerinckia sp. L45 TaxID=1641855 RepID=UPI00131AAE3B|nr:type II toxin-antitoxin system RatA family toxin [Beijerinckia sp. L45]